MTLRLRPLGSLMKGMLQQGSINTKVKVNLM
jgi:hypothetical protein